MACLWTQFDAVGVLAAASGESGGPVAEGPSSPQEERAADNERDEDSLAGLELNPMSSMLSSSAPELSGEWHEVRRRRAAAAREHEESEHAAKEWKEKVRIAFWVVLFFICACLTGWLADCERVRDVHIASKSHSPSLFSSFFLAK